MRKILLTGKNGQVGWELQRTLACLGDVVAVGHREMDLADPDSIRRVIGQVRPGLIVNAAAYTAVDKAETEPDLAMAINGVAPGVMAEEAKQLNATVIHYSTDYVFDGTKKLPYVEDDQPKPLNVYGQTKLAGERAIQATGVPHLILRTGWVYSSRGNNFLLTILRLAQERKELNIVNDQIGAPTWSRMLAEATAQMLTKNISPVSGFTDSVANISGLYHVVSGGSTSWYGFARKILEVFSGYSSRPLSELRPIPATEYPLPARRPSNSCMSNEKLKHICGLVLPSWENSLMLCMGEVVNAPAK